MATTDVTAYLKLMVAKEGSDLHFSAGAPVNRSIQGTTYPIGKHVLGGLEVRELVYSVLNDEHKTQFDREFELNAALSFGELGRFRINVFGQRGEVAMVARYLESNIPTIESLGLPPILEDLIAEGRISAEAALQNADSRSNLRLKMRLEHAPGAHGLPELTLDNEAEAVSLDLRRHH